MSERLTVCIKCGAKRFSTITVINPDTVDMNMKAVLRCDGCGNEAVYEVASNHHKEQRRRGFRI